MTPEQRKHLREIRFGRFTSQYHTLHLLPDPRLGLPGAPMPVIITAWNGSDLRPSFQSLN